MKKRKAATSSWVQRRLLKVSSNRASSAPLPPPPMEPMNNWVLAEFASSSSSSTSSSSSISSPTTTTTTTTTARGGEAAAPDQEGNTQELRALLARLQAENSMLRSQLHDAPLPRRSPQALLSSDRSTQTDPDRVTVMDSFWLSKIRASERRSMAQVAPPPSTTLAAAMDIEDATEEGSAASVVHEQRAPQPQPPQVPPAVLPSPPPSLPQTRPPQAQPPKKTEPKPKSNLEAQPKVQVLPEMQPAQLQTQTDPQPEGEEKKGGAERQAVGNSGGSLQESRSTNETLLRAQLLAGISKRTPTPEETSAGGSVSAEPNDDAEPPVDDASDILQPHSRGKVVGLVKAPDKNGSAIEVLHFDAERQRYRVEFLDNGRVVEVQPTDEGDGPSIGPSPSVQFESEFGMLRRQNIVASESGDSGFEESTVDFLTRRHAALVVHRGQGDQDFDAEACSLFELQRRGTPPEEFFPGVDLESFLLARPAVFTVTGNGRNALVKLAISPNKAPKQPPSTTTATTTTTCTTTANSKSSDKKTANGTPPVSPKKDPAFQHKPSSRAYIYDCNNETYPECMSRRIFGGPLGSLTEMKGITGGGGSGGTTLFLRNVQSNTVSGPFWSISKAAKNLDKVAFGGRYPAQVRVVHAGAVGSLPIRNTPLKSGTKSRWIDAPRAEKLVGQLLSVKVPVKVTTMVAKSSSSVSSPPPFGSQVLGGKASQLRSSPRTTRRT
jgi:hypothetical protein